jgi:hypothetical protein
MKARCSSAGIVSELSGGLSAHCQKCSNASITGPSAVPGKTGAGPFPRPTSRDTRFDQKLGFNPDVLVTDALGIGLGPSDEWFKPLLQIGGRDLVEAVVNFAGVDQIVALAPADVEPIPLRTIECETGNGQRLPLRVGLFDPIVRPSRRIGAAPHFRDDALEAEFAGVREHLAAVYLEAFAVLDVGAI